MGILLSQLACVTADLKADGTLEHAIKADSGTAGLALSFLVRGERTESTGALIGLDDDVLKVYLPLGDYVELLLSVLAKYMNRIA